MLNKYLLGKQRSYLTESSGWPEERSVSLFYRWWLETHGDEIVFLNSLHSKSGIQNQFGWSLMFLHPFTDKYYKPKLQQFWRVEKGKGKLVTLQWKNLQMLPYPKLTWPVIRTPHDTMWYPLTGHDEKGTSLDFLPTSPDFPLIMRRHQTNLQWWTFYKIPDWYFSKGSRSYEQKTENHQRP